MGTMKRAIRLGAAVLAAVYLTACSYADPNTDYSIPTQKGNKGGHSSANSRYDSIFGPGGLGFGTDKPVEPGAGGGSGIGVNSYLWRASLDTMSFMPLASADPFGGVIITDWYTPPEVREERFKVTVYILGRELRADGLRASVFRQRQGAEGNWVDAGVEPRTGAELENAILVRARQLRIAGLQ